MAPVDRREEIVAVSRRPGRMLLIQRGPAAHRSVPHAQFVAMDPGLDGDPELFERILPRL